MFDPDCGLALHLATTLHEGTVDKAGMPYIDHPIRVAALLQKRWPDATSAQIQAAFLHDVIEDCRVSASMLIEAGIAPAAVRIILNVTKPAERNDLPYLVWIREIAAMRDVGTLRVKLADLTDNMDLTRPCFVGRKSMVSERYSPAYHILDTTLQQIVGA
jgi:(p)ppGpp synthase/HD superfamily hydrolase